MQWEDHIVEREALRDGNGRIICGSENRAAADIVQDVEASADGTDEESAVVARRTLEFVERLVALPTLTAQRIVLEFVRGEKDVARIAEKLELSRWTVWRVKRQLDADGFWSRFVRK